MLLRRYHNQNDSETVDKDKKSTNSSNKKKVNKNGGAKQSK
ncbi:hypothetical protein NSA56_01840 [Oceanobacillus caeni]|nr:hypothetical protein [Oceanobacillus caeni]MCR1833138.1 hypothetical protein [Oceanobacillus caeni]